MKLKSFKKLVTHILDRYGADLDSQSGSELIRYETLAEVASLLFGT